MNKTVIIILAVIVAVVILVAIFYKPANTIQPMPQTQTPSSPTQAQSSGQTPASGQQTVSIVNFSFQPTPLTVTVGTTVVWTNNDSVPHQIKSDTFNSNPLSQGQTFSFTFQTAGTYDYSCAIHPAMHGQIIVK